MTEEKKPHKRPMRYWQDPSNIESGLRTWIAKQGRFPTCKDLSESGEKALLGAVQKYGGISAWRVRLGFDQLRKPQGFWVEIANATSELQLIASELGHFPTANELQTRNCSLLAAIESHHGGYRAIRRMLGQAQLSVSVSYWREWDHVEREVRMCIEKFGHLPTTTELQKEGKHGLLRGIMKYHGGLGEVARRLSVQPGRRSPGFWREWVNVERVLRDVMLDLGRFPSWNDLKERGLTGMLESIKRHHSGMVAVRIRLGTPDTKRRAGYWSDPANVERELRAWIVQHNKFPTQKDLARTGAGGLHGAISKQGGIAVWRAKLGYARLSRPAGYWDDPANVEREVREWIATYGKFPSMEDLAGTSCGALNSGISRHGGYPVWRAKLGYGPITPECLRDHADILARVVMALNVADTTSFWAALQARWTMHELTEAIREFTEEGKLERFAKLLVAAD